MLPTVAAVLELDPVDGLFELAIEVVDPELVEVAKHDIGRPIGNEVDPVLEGLPIILREVPPSFLHLNQDARLSLQVGIGGASVVPLLDALLQCRAGLANTSVAKRLKEIFQEDGGFALSRTLQMGLAVANEVVEAPAKFVRSQVCRHQSTSLRVSDSLVIGSDPSQASLVLKVPALPLGSCQRRIRSSLRSHHEPEARGLPDRRSTRRRKSPRDLAQLMSPSRAGLLRRRCALVPRLVPT
jgi:hypothetical protein